MGCDIHVHAELKIDGKWEHYSCPDIKRNYRLFGLMAGVRDYSIQPIASPRGLPEDLSVITKIDAARMESDAHSHSYITPKEIVIVEESMDDMNGLTAFKETGWLFGNSWAGFVKYPEDNEPTIQDIRWVFWFDN